MEHIIAKEYDYCLVVKGGRAGSVSVTEKRTLLQASGIGTGQVVE